MNKRLFDVTMFAVLAMVVVVLVTSCAGPVGPQGEAGPMGPAGPPGADGVCEECAAVEVKPVMRVEAEASCNGDFKPWPVEAWLLEGHQMVNVWVDLPSGNQCGSKIFLIPDVQIKSGLGTQTFGVVHYWVADKQYLMTDAVALWQKDPNGRWGVVVQFDSETIGWGKKYMTDAFPTDRPARASITIPIP